MYKMVEFLVKSIVDNPQAVEIKEIQGEKVIIYEVKVDNTDVGKVVGRNGRIINSIRTIVRAAASKERKKVSIELMA